MIYSKIMKVAAATAIAVCMSVGAQAQGVYAKIGGGYNFGFASYLYYNTTENIIYTENGPPTGSIKFEPRKVNLGQGSTAGGALGYMFNKNIGFEVGINYLAGKKNAFKREVNVSGTDNSSPFPGVQMPSTKDDRTMQSQMILIQPALVLALGLQKFNPYTRLGLVVARGSIEETFSYSDSYGNTVEREVRSFGGTGFGLQTALGLNFNFSDKLALFTEGTINHLTYSPEKGEVTKSTRNGVDLMPTLETSEKEIRYEDEATFSYSEQPSPSEPSIEVKQKSLLHSFGLNIGLKYNF